MPHSHGHVCEPEADHHDHDHSPPPEETNQVQSLYDKVQHHAVRALNVVIPESGFKIIRPWNERFSIHSECISDADEQIILHVPFDGQIKLKSILLRCPNQLSAPKSMDVFVNKEDLDFDTIEDAKPIETFECVPYENASDIIEYPVKVRLYHNVKCITLYFSQNWSEHDGLPTQLWYLGFRGEHTQLSEAPVTITYEAFANPQDHKVRAKGIHSATNRMGM